MDITPTATISNTPGATKSPENHETETPTRIITTPTPTTAAATKTLSFSNGVLKRHHPHHPSAAVVTYKECLKNHAANLGGHALDGCGEFMQSPAATAADPTSIKCAACGCHRNFHRRDPEEPPIASTTTHVIEYQPLHRHHPPPPPFAARSPNSASPPPISSSYYPSAPHMLLALSAAGGLAAPPESTAAPSSAATRKRFRTKFTQDQKEKMHKFAEKVGWKMQKRDDDLVHEFCNEIGVDRSVLKVWMHNNKNTFAKKDNNNDISIAPIITSKNISNDNVNGGDKSFVEVPNSVGTGAEDHIEDPTRNHHYGGANALFAFDDGKRGVEKEGFEEKVSGKRSSFFNSCRIGPGDFCGEELLTWALGPRPSLTLPSSTCSVKAVSEVEAFALTAESTKAFNVFNRDSLLVCSFFKLSPSFVALTIPPHPIVPA
ncbi:hypothetical protein Fmac_017564 [Flemingia macrophylla]|uniref:ZF-HD dimerization-type domain-containing protein n=1 Tax=Flemingia macrophylla TaxID=520843 RepID=A0ABD1M2G4_9FABA